VRSSVAGDIPAAAECCLGIGKSTLFSLPHVYLGGIIESWSRGIVNIIVLL
jgi:hypothetical protein